MTQANLEFGVSRRQFMAALLAVGAAARVRGVQQTAGAARVQQFLRSIVGEDGGYGWPDETDSHLTPTYAAVGCYRALNLPVPDKARVAKFLHTNHPVQFTRPESPLHNFEHQQIQALIWLGEEVATFKQQVRKRVKPHVYPVAYEKHSWPIFQMEVTAFLCRELLGMPTNDLDPQFISYLESRRRANGSFNNTPADDSSDGHVMNTWWGVQAMRVLGRGGEKNCETAQWVRACQLESGGFTHAPRASIGGVGDVAYTWAAVRVLSHFGAELDKRQACIDWLLSLWNSDGGFGDQPGWSSNAVATFYALEALATLKALDALAAKPPARASVAVLEVPSEMKVFTIQIEASGRGSPAEAVELARSLRIHLWGAKNSPAGWIGRAQAIADQRKAPVTFFAANEEYGTLVSVPGMGTYSHTSDIIAPAGGDFGPSLAAAGPVTWEQFRARRLAPLEKAGGRLVWQFGENEELCRLYLDDSIRRGGYAAISTFHFGNPDFTISQPFLLRYRHQLPFIALQDAHGEESWWWGDMLEGFRTLFVAREPTWQGWLEALKKDWVVAVRRDEVTGNRLRIHGGAAGIQEFVGAQKQQWQWWDNPQISRPPASIVILRPDDAFEAGRPEKGIAVRVRCRWINTKQGLPKSAVTELVELKVDGRAVQTEVVRTRAAKGGVADHYHRHVMAEASPGRHTATAVVKEIANQKQSELSVEFGG